MSQRIAFALTLPAMLVVSQSIEALKQWRDSRSPADRQSEADARIGKSLDLLHLAHSAIGDASYLIDGKPERPDRVPTCPACGRVHFAGSPCEL